MTATPDSRCIEDAFRTKGRLLGVDYGSVRVGLAICDSERIIASPFAIYRRRDGAADAEYFRKLVRAEEVIALVVGLPVHMSGDEGEKAKEARAFGAWLAGATSLPVTYWDERFTTQDAEAFMRGAKLTAQQRKERRDKVAAQIMLQAYIEAGCPEESAPGAVDQAPSSAMPRPIE